MRDVQSLGAEERDQSRINRYIRGCLSSHIYDETGGCREGTAIYTLSDPRSTREVRYVGQTRSPRRRFLQHMGTARLEMPDEVPWWIQSPRLRPLYEWIRLLYQDEHRLPVMVIAEWVEKQSNARSAERALIQQCLQQGLSLLNVVPRLSGPQIPLL